jgi:hypothetical protein
MKHIILVLAIACAGAAFLTSGGPTSAYSGIPWAVQACTAAGELCHRPLSFAVAAAALSAVWLMATLVAVFSNS